MLTMSKNTQYFANGKFRHFQNMKSVCKFKKIYLLESEGSFKVTCEEDEERKNKRRET